MTTKDDSINQNTRTYINPCFHPLLGNRYPATMAITILITIPITAPLDNKIEYEINDSQRKSIDAVNNAAKYTAGKAAKMPPAFSPNFLPITVETTTALPPMKNLINNALTDIKVIIYSPTFQYQVRGLNYVDHFTKN